MVETLSGRTGVVRVRDEHLPALTEFLRKTWDPGATTDSVRQARAALAANNPHGAGTDVPTFLFLRDGAAVGHIGTIPIRLLINGQTCDAHWLKGLMVLPEFRGGPVGFLLVKEAARELGWAMALVVRPEARKLFTALGFHDRGALADSLRVLDALGVTNMDLSQLGEAGGGLAKMLGMLQRWHLAGAAGQAARGTLALWTAAVGRGTGSVQTGPLAGFDKAALDTLWQRVAPPLEAAPVRDAHYLVHRYHDEAYAAALCSDAAGPLALAVVRRPRAQGDPRLAGIRVATLSDLVATGQSSALAAIAAAEELARGFGGQALLCAASHRTVAPWLLRRGFLQVGASVHLLARGPDASAVVPALEQWWLTRGDSDADEVF